MSKNNDFGQTQCDEYNPLLNPIELCGDTRYKCTMNVKVKGNISPPGVNTQKGNATFFTIGGWLDLDENSL